MKFAQIIEFTTGRIDEFNAGLDEWMARSEGHRIPHRAVLRRDRDARDRYLLTVEFASYEQGMDNSGRPETGEFAAFLAGISEGALTFRNLDVLREEDLWRCHGARAPSTPTLAGPARPDYVMQRGGIFNPPGRMARQGFGQAAAAGII